MDKQLAEFYGTNQIDADELEKMASAELAEALADEGNAEFDGLTDEDLEEAAMEILEDDGSGEEYIDEETVKTAMAEDYDHADRMGRIMAHAYVQELGEIEKVAATEEQIAKDMKSLPIGTRMKGHLRHAGQLLAGGVGKGSGEKGAKTLSEIALGMKGQRGKVWGARGAAGAGIAAAGYGAKKLHDKMTKKSSAFETLVEARAAEILEANGIDPETFEKVAFDPPTKPMSVGEAYDEAHKATKNLVPKARAAAKRFGTALAGGEGAKSVSERILGMKGQRGKVWGARGGAAAGLAAAGYGAKKLHDRMSEKRSSVDPEVLAEAVEGNAIALLEEFGFEFEG